jgi:hypothetical protein
MRAEKTKLQYNAVFWLHAVITLLAWVGPFLFHWVLMCVCYAIAIAQHKILKKCILNDKHGIDENEDHTIYSAVFEELGIQLPRKKVKKFVRNYLYFLLALCTVFLQVICNYQPLLF